MIMMPYAIPANLEWLIDQLTCIEMEEQKTVGGKCYNHYAHPKDEPDDAYTLSFTL